MGKTTGDDRAVANAARLALVDEGLRELGFEASGWSGREGTLCLRVDEAERLLEALRAPRSDQGGG